MRFRPQGFLWAEHLIATQLQELQQESRPHWGKTFLQHKTGLKIQMDAPSRDTAGASYIQEKQQSQTRKAKTESAILSLSGKRKETKKVILNDRFFQMQTE